MAPQKLDHQERSGPQGARILVVDDNPDNLLLLKGILCGAGYRVIKASCPGEAWDILRREPVDLIICDVMMPEISGYDFCQLLRKDPKLRDIPVVLITSKRLEVSDAILGMEAGADDYLTRPIDHRLLVQKIQVLITKKYQKEALEERLEEQEERLKALISFTNMIVHDMRNPLQVAMGYLDLILQENLSPRHRRWLSLVYEVLNRQRQFLEDLLILAATRDGRLKPEISLVNLNEVIQNLVALYQQQAKEQKRQIVFENLSGEEKIISDRRLLTRVIDNLLANAMKYGCGDIHLRLEEAHLSNLINQESARGIVFSIFNHCPPIPIELQRTVFEPFVQLPSGGKKGGIGLGLYFCRLVLEALGGRLGLVSPAPKSNEGVIFYFFLPPEPPQAIYPQH